MYQRSKVEDIITAAIHEWIGHAALSMNIGAMKLHDKDSREKDGAMVNHHKNGWDNFKKFRGFNWVHIEK